MMVTTDSHLFILFTKWKRKIVTMEFLLFYLSDGEITISSFPSLPLPHHQAGVTGHIVPGFQLLPVSLPPPFFVVAAPGGRLGFHTSGLLWSCLHVVALA